MKHLNIAQQQPALLSLYGAFHAVGNEEYMKHAKKGIRYGVAGYDLYAPVAVCKDLWQAMSNMESELNNK